MISRRKFLGRSLIGSLGMLTASQTACQPTPLETSVPVSPIAGEPIVISTWDHGIPANAAAWQRLQQGGSALDAVEAGVMVVEADPNTTTVGYGSTPDRDGHVTLDACIMDHDGNCGSVCFIEHIMHPISVARKVMEDTPHVMLAGEGALQFALSAGFEKMDLLTPEAKERWEKWLVEKQYKPLINIENHDTIGMIAIDGKGHLAASCTTSGLGYKMRGRVGDSPVIGAGLYCDGEVGAVVATGLGEMILKTLGSFLIVELMRQGASPQEACEEGIRRLAKKVKNYEEAQAAFIAIDKNRAFGAYAIHPGFSYAIARGTENQLIRCDSLLKN